MNKKGGRRSYGGWIAAIVCGILCTVALSVNIVVADPSIAGQDLKFGMGYDSTAISLDGASKLLVVLVKLRQNLPPDSWSWSVGAAALAFLLYNLWRHKEERPGKGVAFLSAVFGVVQVLGLSICKLDSWAFVSENFYQMLLALCCMAGYGILFYHAVWGFFLALRRVAAYREKTPGNSLAKAFAKNPARISGGLILLGWLPWVLACLPGSVDWDSHTQICQALGSMEMTAHHTVLSTWLHGGLVQVGRLFGSDNLGVFLYVLLQCLVCAWIYGQIVAFCAKLKAPRWLQYAVTSFFALVPVWGAFAQSMVKDTLFAAVFSLFVLYTADVWIFADEYEAQPILYARYAVSALLVCLLRNNGVIAVFPVLLLMGCRAAWKRKNWKRVAVAVSVIVVYFAFNSIMTNLLSIAPGGINEALSIPLQQTARYVVVYGDEVTEEERAAIDAVVDYDQLAENYQPMISDGVKGLYKNPSSQDLMRYFKTWFSMFWKHPTCYLQATQANSYGYYTIAESNFDLEYYMFINEPSMEWKDLNISYLDTSGEARYILYHWALLFERLPLLGLLANHGFVTWWLVAICAWLLKRKAGQALPAVLAVGMLWLTCVASPVNDLLRYFLPILACLPIFLALACWATSPKSRKVS